MTAVTYPRKFATAALHLPATVTVDTVRKVTDALIEFSTMRHDQSHRRFPPGHPWYRRESWEECREKWCRLDRLLIDELYAAAALAEHDEAIRPYDAP